MAGDRGGVAPGPPPLPEHRRQAPPGGLWRLAARDPVEQGTTGLLRPMEQQAGLADTASPIGDQELRSWIVEQGIQLAQFGLSVDERRRGHWKAPLGL